MSAADWLLLLSVLALVFLAGRAAFRRRGSCGCGGSCPGCGCQSCAETACRERRKG